MSAYVETTYDRCPFNCAECGGAVWLLARSGRTCSYKGERPFTVPAALAIPTCDDCDAEWIDDEIASVLDEACAAQEGGVR